MHTWRIQGITKQQGLPRKTIAIQVEISCLKNKVKDEFAKEQPELPTNDRKLSVKESADLCANKFETTDPIERKEYFMSYCITSANQIIPKDTLPSIEEEVLIKEKLDVFQQMFYNEKVLFNKDQDPVGISITKLYRANDSESSQDESFSLLTHQVIANVNLIKNSMSRIVSFVLWEVHVPAYVSIEQKDLEAWNWMKSHLNCFNMKET